MADLDDDELLEALGVEVAPIKAGGRTPREERIIAGFEDILRFFDAHQRAPKHGEGRDIFERLYAVRLDQLRKLPEARALLAEMDRPGLLAEPSSTPADPDALDEDALLAALGVSSDPADPADITVLRHVRPLAERQAAEEIAERTPCEDFEKFQPLFERVERELKEGMRKAIPFKGEASVEQGNFFIVGGQFAYVAEKGEEFETSSRQPDARLRLIYGNGTESNLLMRSLQKALTQDGNGRRLSEPDAGPLFSTPAGPQFGDTAEADDIETGTIYVLRSLSTHPFVSEHRMLIHKIGVTGGKVATRIADAENQATYLLAPVDIVAEYTLHNLNRTRMENIFHRLFGAVQLDLTIEDRFGKPVKPQEWFFVPLQVIDEAVERIRDGSITQYEYEPRTAKLERAPTRN
ncbi:GIY-YIG nuclease family protein [Piscinibacter sp. HJYY11]|uniref:GIY-YIG nuclease family protein n=1 Tax=Piscinibacter sp. HJYY11 TaxID=2801333 RepID=UPI00191FFB43|nr:GIY-YIG nuclease family protein [Piscinibacter sp. HJYY11]MBL0726129.1 GIY-YIG nuclease family protein [Piscinibacter sp. HJYY11]